MSFLPSTGAYGIRGDYSTVGRYGAAGLNPTTILDELAKNDVLDDDARAQLRASAGIHRDARRLQHAGRPRQAPPFSEAPLPKATRRGTSNRDEHRRKCWLLEEFGDGTWAPCYRCGLQLDIRTITVDRIKPKKQGGRYVRGNIRPACRPCNSETGGMLATETGRARLAEEEAARLAVAGD